MRRPIDKNFCTEIGYIKKTHGLNGEVMIVFNEGIDQTIETIEYLFIESEGLLVPFFIESLQFRSDFSANLGLTFLDSLVKAKQMVGCKLFVWNDDLVHQDEGFYLSMLMDYTLIEKSMGQIGPVIATDDFGGNPVITVKYQNREVMIPINEELIVKIDREARVLIMDLPEGLLALD